jgi:hypothetical protein
MDESRIPRKCIIYEFGNNKTENRPRNRWQDEVRENIRLVSGKGGRKEYITERNGRSS